MTSATIEDIISRAFFSFFFFPNNGAPQVFNHLTGLLQLTRFQLLTIFPVKFEVRCPHVGSAVLNVLKGLTQNCEDTSKYTRLCFFNHFTPVTSSGGGHHSWVFFFRVG